MIVAVLVQGSVVASSGVFGASKLWSVEWSYTSFDAISLLYTMTLPRLSTGLSTTIGDRRVSASAEDKISTEFTLPRV